MRPVNITKAVAAPDIQHVPPSNARKVMPLQRSAVWSSSARPVGSYSRGSQGIGENTCDAAT